MGTSLTPRRGFRSRLVPIAATVAFAAIVSPLAGAQENLGDNDPDDTFFTYAFADDQKLSASMPVKVATVAGPQSPSADLEFSPSVYAVSLSYGIESPSGRLRTAVVVKSDAGEAGRTKTVRATLSRTQLSALRAAARRSHKRSVYVVVQGLAKRINGGNPGSVKRGKRLDL